MGKKITVGSPLSEGGVIHGYPIPIGSMVLVYVLTFGVY